MLALTQVHTEAMMKKLLVCLFHVTLLSLSCDCTMRSTNAMVGCPNDYHLLPSDGACYRVAARANRVR